MGYRAIVLEFPPPDFLASLRHFVDRYEGARRQVWEKIEDYQIRRASIRQVSIVNVQKGAISVDKSVTVHQSGTGNIINIAEYMSGVTNQVNNNLQQSSQSEDVKALVQQLVEQVKAISAKADPKQTQAMGKNLKRLSDELAEPEPDRAWYEVSLKGLKEAAEAVEALTDLAEVIAVPIEFEHARVTAARVHEHVSLGVGGDADALAEIHVRRQLEEVRHRGERDLGHVLRFCLGLGKKRRSTEQCNDDGATGQELRHEEPPARNAATEMSNLHENLLRAVGNRTRVTAPAR